MKTYEYPINENHSTVLGYTATSKFGRKLWDELDWRGVRQDGGQHFMNQSGGEYLHVRCKYNPDQDGRKPVPLSHRRWYRVRCRHEIGTKWRAGHVADVKVKKSGKRWLWSIIVAESLEEWKRITPVILALADDFCGILLTIR